MKLVMFTKMLKEKALADLPALAQDWGLDGYDLCVRPGCAVHPGNVAEELPRLAASLRAAGLDLPMVTGDTNLLEPEHPSVKPLVQAMARADVRLLKLGYWHYDPRRHDYLAEVARLRETLGRWERLAQTYGVRICYHTHSHQCLGLNGAALAQLLAGFDPQYLGAYIDPGHLALEGEDFATAAGMLRPWLSLVAVKDLLLTRIERNGHGAIRHDWVQAGEGVVDWTSVFAVLREVGYDNPVSIHCEFHVPPERFAAAAPREVAFFRRFVPRTV